MTILPVLHFDNDDDLELVHFCINFIIFTLYVALSKMKGGFLGIDKTCVEV